jgi:uncharacterized protein YdaL
MSPRIAYLLLILLLGLLLAPRAAQAQLTPLPRALVLYDSAGKDGWQGRLYVQCMQNLLSHFEVTTVVKPVERYVAGEIAGYRAVFYLGMVYDNPLPAAFKIDVMKNTTVTVCWVNHNLWEVAWTKGAYNTAFETKFAFRYLDILEGRYSRFRYKNTVLTKDPADLLIANLGILNPVKAVVRATAFDPAVPAVEIPYVVQSGKLWYIGDNPFLTFDSNTDRCLIFADLLHDILGINHPALRRAFLRIEDVSAVSDPAVLRRVADTLWSLKVPFAISLIPEYRDPLGIFYDGEVRKLRLEDRPQVAAALRYMVSRGGQVLMHGYTHQFESLKNPINGLSGTDYEFVLVRENPDKSQDVLGPVPGDSAAWCDARLLAGMTNLARVGLRPAGWLTPHYMASPTDYRVIAKRFPVCVERGFYFAQGLDGTYYTAMQTFPYVVRDVYGLKHIPETIGYLNPTATPPSLPANLVANAEANLVVRDGWASGFFHWYMDPTQLPELINGIRAKGYTFVPLANYPR